MSELENAEKEARKWMREDTPVAPNSLYWSRVLSERDVLKGQLDAMEEQLAAKDARIAELERGRTVVESEAARRVRSVFAGFDADYRARLLRVFRAGGDPMTDAFADFLESAPPASAPNDDEIVSALAERTRQVAQIQDDLCDARYARDKARKEIAALKAAPARSEREVDAELANALRSWRAWYQSAPTESEPGMAGTNARMELARASARWLAAPLPAEDEYTRAALAYAEAYMAWQTSYDVKHGDAVTRAYRVLLSLYTARHSAAASAPKVEPIAPPQADGERVAMYAMRIERGDVSGSLYSEKERRGITLRPGCSWLALDARVVREGGGK